MAQAYAAHCIARKRPGCIVNIASTHGMTGFAGRTVYGIAKGGLIQMTRMLAIEWIAHNIRVNAIAPVTALTPSRAAMYDDATRARMLARIPIGRFITPEEVAAAVVFLASPGAVVDHRRDARRRRRLHGELTLVCRWSLRRIRIRPCDALSNPVCPARPRRKRALRPDRLRHRSTVRKVRP